MTVKRIHDDLEMKWMCIYPTDRDAVEQFVAAVSAEDLAVWFFARLDDAANDQFATYWESNWERVTVQIAFHMQQIGFSNPLLHDVRMLIFDLANVFTGLERDELSSEQAERILKYMAKHWNASLREPVMTLCAEIASQRVGE